MLVCYNKTNADVKYIYIYIKTYMMLVRLFHKYPIRVSSVRQSLTKIIFNITLSMTETITCNVVSEYDILSQYTLSGHS